MFQQAVAQRMKRVDDQIIYDGKTYKLGQTGHFFVDKPLAKEAFKSYLTFDKKANHQYGVAMVSGSLAVLGLIGGPLVGSYQSKVGGLSPVPTGDQVSIFFWSGILFGTGLISFGLSSQNSRKARQSLEEAIDIYNAFDGEGVGLITEPKIDLGLEIRGNGVGLKYTF